MREAKPPRDDGTVAREGTDEPPSPAAGRVREGTTFPELFPLLVTALLALPLLLLLVLGTELAPPPPPCCCVRLLDMMQQKTHPKTRCTSKHPERCLFAPSDLQASWLAYHALASSVEGTASKTYSVIKLVRRWVPSTYHRQRFIKSLDYKV